MKRASLLLLIGFGLAACKDKDELLAQAEQKGQLLAEEHARLAKGIGDGLQKEGKGAGESVAKGVAEVVRSGVKGAVQGATEVPISVSAGVQESGLKAERAALHNEPNANGVKVYLILERAYRGPLTLLARDDQGREAGRAKVEVDEAEPTGKYLFFPFDKMVDLSSFAKLELL